MIPVLMITYNRKAYTEKALTALLQCRQAIPVIVDNGSTDGTLQMLHEFQFIYGCLTIFSSKVNLGIAGAMNIFLHFGSKHEFVGKVDNDTIVQPDFIERMLPHMKHADIVQAKHPLIPASGVGTFIDWVAKMPAVGPLRFNHFVGGSGILFKRKVVTKIPNTEWKLGGWRQWQREHPDVKKAFATDVEIELLDTNDNGVDYSTYPDYYKETGRA